MIWEERQEYIGQCNDIGNLLCFKLERWVNGCFLYYYIIYYYMLYCYIYYSDLKYTRMYDMYSVFLDL